MIELKNRWIKFSFSNTLTNETIKLNDTSQNNTRLNRTPLAVWDFKLRMTSKFSMDGSELTTQQSIGIKTDS